MRRRRRRYPLSPPTRGRPGRAGRDSDAAEGPGPCGALVPLTAAAERQASILGVGVPRREGPAVLCPRPRWHQLQPDPESAAARGRRPVQLPAPPARQAPTRHQAREASALCVGGRWVITAGLHSGAVDFPSCPLCPGSFAVKRLKYKTQACECIRWKHVTFEEK